MATPALVNDPAELLALPASPAQERFWILDQLKKGDSSLNVAVRFILSGDLDIAVLTRSLNEVVRRHEILRANFDLVDGNLAQVVAPVREIELPLTDLSTLDEASRTAESDRIADEIARESFTLEAGPLLRARLLRLAEARHILLITVHHIVSDGWSIGVITDELGASYEAFIAGRPSPLPDLAIQYADYTIWQQTEQESQAGENESEEYWRERLANLPHFEILGDFPRSPKAEAQGHIVSRLLPRDLTDTLQSLSREHNATLFMTMYAALCALLSRYTGEEDIVTGTHVAGRGTVEVEPLIGPFANNLVLRTDTSGDPGFLDLLNRAVDAVAGALSHQDLPYERITARRGDASLLFRINFIHQRDFVRPWQCGNLRMDPIPSRSPGALYDLNLFLVERIDGWRLSCEYNTNLYRPARVEALLEHFELLLSSIAANPELRISERNFLSETEQHRLMIEWNDTAVPYPSDLTIHQLLENAARQMPDRVAATFQDQSITYAELDGRSNRLARYLQARGACPGVFAGICMDRSLDMLVSVIAVLKTGAAYLPLDPAFPANRLEFMSQDANIALLLTTRSLAGHINTNAKRILVDQEQFPIGAESPKPLAEKVPSDAVAYILYTSGSTGKPKGVEVQHCSVINLLYAIQSHVQLSADDSLLAITTLSFDIAALELYLPLLTGSRLILASHQQTSDPLMLRDLLIQAKPTLLQATPVTWRMLLDAGWAGSPGLKMLCGGEKLSRELADALLAKGGPLWNVYGPTETTIWSTVSKIEADAEPVTIGRPLANTLIYVLDSHLALVPVGVPGELFIGGDGVARGYLNREELTAQRFIPNPFGPGRLYRTGDLVRYWPDGRIEMLGRNDAQVKVRGFRIELGEVESALAACPGVRSAAVVVRQDAAGESVLAGYFVAREEGGADPASVRRVMAERLPDYMVPTWLIAMDVLPVTPNGKLDRNALPAPESIVVPTTGDCSTEIAPDALEASIIGIWEAVLGTRPVRRTDNFFELGGHSVLAARMFARMEKVLGKTLPLATLFQAPTVAQLAMLIRDADWTPLWSSLVPIRSTGSKPPFFFVHPIGGNVLNFSGFCSYFGLEQPIYGLQARGLGGDVAPHISIPEMSADYIRAIQTVQPEGPYFIGGFSAGGVVAFEMVRQLTAAGHEVALLALLDTSIQSQDKMQSNSRVGNWLGTVRRNVRYATRMAPRDYVARKVKNVRTRVVLSNWELRESMGLANDEMHLDAEEAFMLAMRRYVPPPFDGNATLFRAGHDYPDPQLGWGSVIRGRLDIQVTSGDHDTILHEPHIGMLARLLEQSLERSRSGEPERTAPRQSSDRSASVPQLRPAVDMGNS